MVGRGLEARKAVTEGQSKRDATEKSIQLSTKVAGQLIRPPPFPWDHPQRSIQANPSSPHRPASSGLRRQLAATRQRNRLITVSHPELQQHAVEGGAPAGAFWLSLGAG